MPEICVRVTQEEDWFVALCLDYDVASQGRTLQSALDNIREAVEGFLEFASPEEVQRCMNEHGPIHIVSLDSDEVDGTARMASG